MHVCVRYAGELLNGVGGADRDELQKQRSACTPQTHHTIAEAAPAQRRAGSEPYPGLLVAGTNCHCQFTAGHTALPEVPLGVRSAAVGDIDDGMPCSVAGGVNDG